MRLLPLLLVATLFGCDTPTSSNGFISPFDGQTDWSTVEPLWVHLPEPLAPHGQLLPEDLLSVVDLDIGGRVEGEVAAEGNDLWFFPDAPFASGHRFAFSVAAPFDQAREVHLAIPTRLQGTSSFHTGPRTEPLAAAFQNGELCVLLSRHTEPQTDGGVQAWANGEALVLTSPEPIGIAGIELEAPPASVQCGPTASPPPSGVRVERGAEVWQIPVQAGTVQSALRARHRNINAEASP